MARKSFESSSAASASDTFDQFVSIEAAANQQALLRELVGDAPGSSRDEDVQRLHEAKEYFNHLNTMGDREDDLNNMPSPAFEREWNDAASANEAFDQAHVDAEVAFAEMIASDPKTRRLQGVANEVTAMREQLGNNPDDTELAKRFKNREDSLEELLIAFGESSNLSASDKELITDYFIDPSTPIPVSFNAAAEQAPTPEASQTPIFEQLAADYQLDPDLLALLDADIANQEVLTIDTRVDANMTQSDEDILALLDADIANQEVLNIDETDAETAQSDEEALAALDAEAENQAPIDTGDLYSDDAPLTTDMRKILENREDQHDDQPVTDNQEFSWFRNPILKTSALYTSALTSLANLRNRRTGKHSPSADIDGGIESKKGSRRTTGLAIGAVAIIGAVAAWRLGVFDQLNDQLGNGIDPNIITPPDNGGGNGGNEIITTPPELPTPGTGGEVIPPVTGPSPETTQHIIETYRDAFNVPQDSGGIALTERLGGSEADWYNKVAPGLVDKYPQYFEHVTDAHGQSDIWISQPGQLPVSIEQDILHRLGKI